MTSTQFRNSYDAARAAGFPGTRSEFASMVLAAPTLFRGQVVAAARSWEADRGELLRRDGVSPSTHERRRGGLILLDVAERR